MGLDKHAVFWTRAAENLLLAAHLHITLIVHIPAGLLKIFLCTFSQKGWIVFYSLRGKFMVNEINFQYQTTGKYGHEYNTHIISLKYIIYYRIKYKYGIKSSDMRLYENKGMYLKKSQMIQHFIGNGPCWNYACGGYYTAVYRTIFQSSHYHNYFKWGALIPVLIHFSFSSYVFTRKLSRTQNPQMGQRSTAFSNICSKVYYAHCQQYLLSMNKFQYKIDY